MAASPQNFNVRLGEADCPTCRKPLEVSGRLVDLASLGKHLSLSAEKVQWLIDTHRIPTIRIRGEVRFDLRDVDQVIDVYANTARRRAYVA